MAVRDSMAGPITRLRGMIGDENTPEQVFTDEQLQDALEPYGASVFFQPLTLEDDNLTWKAGSGNWEASAVIADGNRNTLTLQIADYRNGLFVPSATQSGLYITGRNYDLYGAAADVLVEWAAKTAGDYDYGSHSMQYKRSQPTLARMGLAKQYRRKARPKTVSMVRSDTNTDCR